MKIILSGGAWILGSSCGRLASDSPEKLPEIHQFFSRAPARLGRFDDFTRLGFTAVCIALREAGWTQANASDKTGLIISTRYGVLQTDLQYYATTIEQDALLSSPNLFSYTLPVAIIGECAVFFHLTGPTFCMGDDGRRGMKALETSLFLLRAGKAKRMIAAWIETSPDLAQTKQAGAAAVVLDLACNDVAEPEKTMQGMRERLITPDDEKASSLFHIFPSQAAQGPSSGEAL